MQQHNLDTENLHRSPLSLSDDSGPVFISRNKVYRAINPKFEQSTRELIESGVIEKLYQLNLFPKTEISSKYISGYNLIIEHQLINPPIYPFEWSPEMLRKAALCVLKVNEIANLYGYELKDAHPYNILFSYSNPIFIDLGSIVKKKYPNFWPAYDEFINCYCRPLRLIEIGYRDIFKRLFLLSGATNADELIRLSNRAYNLLSFKVSKFLRRSLSAAHRIESINIETTFSNPSLKWLIKCGIALRALPIKQRDMNSLNKTINSYRFPKTSLWGNYHLKAGLYSNSGNIELSERMNWIVNRVGSLSPRTILELAGNQGVLSRKLALLPTVERIICSDYDQEAIDQLVLRTSMNEKVYPACFDFMCDARESISKERANRFKSDVVIALAVTHHLLLSQNLNIETIFETIVSYVSRYLIIEFMPLGLWDGEKSPPNPEWYTLEWFTEKLTHHFKILEVKNLEENRIIFIAEINI